MSSQAGGKQTKRVFSQIYSARGDGDSSASWHHLLREASDRDRDSDKRIGRPETFSSKAAREGECKV